MHFHRRGLASVLACAVLAGAWTVQNQPVADWIRAHAIRLTTPEAGHGFADMQPLKPVIGSARIVSLGEATHGSREFFQLKHRLLEFLATDMGFTIFSIEANMPEAYRLNDYVLNGAGDPAQLLRGMGFWTWDTEEVLDMIRWMRAFNQSGKGRVEFTGFDMQTPTVAQEIARTFIAKYDAPYLTTFDPAASLVRTASAPATTGFGVASGAFPANAAAGKKIRYSGYIKTEGVTAYAGLWWRVDGPSGVLAFDNMQARGPRGTTDWQRFVIDLPVDASVRNINFGVLMPGQGTAWFDDLTIEIDGQPYSDPNRFALDFELPGLLGLQPGNGVYRVALDSQVAHGGKQSLRISSVDAPATATVGTSSPDARTVGTQWKAIVAHLEAGRAGYMTAGASAKDADWAIQNARVVMQSLQMRSNEVTRDQSMADNIKWIADQNPSAKIVVWAHNGHVAAGGFDYTTMGTALRKMFGREMAVFGFAFNQGSFQAMAQAGGGLKNFTVPAAPADSLDAMLASAGVPLFALDLRNAPPWFTEPHRSREIGATYPEGSPYALMADLPAAQAFDVMLFVDTTTAARKNLAPVTTMATPPLTVTQIASLNAPDGVFDDAAQQVVRDQPAWQALWTRLNSNASPAPTLPAVDFTKDMLVVAAMGMKGHGGYKVAITGAAENAGKVTVEVTETSPGARCMNAMMMSSPVVIAKLPRRAGDVAFTVVRKVVDCQ
ncbi:MAG TPA: erythromycin esterase family protein [Vicinamibacterales bacterium]|nr:erythromycin esterase family protein [Vicinamibacterales bacterium]